MSTDQNTAADPEKTPLYIGAGVQFSGTIRHSGEKDERAVILGEYAGDVDWNGVLHIARGGKLVVDKAVRCREMVVSGEVIGATPEAMIETGLLRLGKTATIEVADVSVPPGGLEQMRGAVVNAKLRMSSENPYAQQDAPAAAGADTPVAPSLTLVSSAETTTSAPTEVSSLDAGCEPPRFLMAQGGAS